MDRVTLVNATAHTFLSAYYATCALLACIVFLCYIWRDRPWLAIFMRYQLAFALACVAFGDAWTGTIGTLFWFMVTEGHADVQQYMIYTLIPARAISLLGFVVAIRAVTFDKYENKIWLGWLLITGIAGVILKTLVLGPE